MSESVENVTVYLVTENFGDWNAVGVYESLDDAKALDPDADWHVVISSPLLRNGGGRRGGRDLFIEAVPFFRSGQGRPEGQRD